MSDDPLDLAPVPSDVRRTPSHSPDPSTLGSDAPSSSRARRDRPPVDYSLKVLLPPVPQSRLSTADKGKGRASTSMAREVLKRGGSTGKRKTKKDSSGTVIKPKSTEPPDPECGFCGTTENPCVAHLLVLMASSILLPQGACSFFASALMLTQTRRCTERRSTRAIPAAAPATTTACTSRASFRRGSRLTSGSVSSANNARSVVRRRTLM